MDNIFKQQMLTQMEKINNEINGFLQLKGSLYDISKVDSNFIIQVTDFKRAILSYKRELDKQNSIEIK